MVLWRFIQTASNGVVHFIDDVVYPIPAGTVHDILTKDKRFNAFVDALSDADDVAQTLNTTSRCQQKKRF
jgi:hypothetical protein